MAVDSGITNDVDTVDGDEEEKKESRQMFQVILSQPNKASAFVNIAWCLTQDGWSYIREKQMKFPHFLIVISRVFEVYGELHEIEYERRLVPLDKALEPVEFFREGTFRVYTYIVHDAQTEHASLARGKMRAGCVKRLASYLEESIGDDYGYFLRGQFIEPKRAARRGQGAIGPWSESAQKGEKVSVEEYLFAPDPPAWLAWWVNLWPREYGFLGDANSRDQCHFKQRAIWAFSGQLILEPIVRLFIMAFRWLYFVLAVLVGHRIRDWRPLYLPYGRSFRKINNVFDKDDFFEEDNFWWITDRKRNIRGYWYPGLLLTPVVWLIVAVATLKSGATFWVVAVGWVALYMSVKIIIAISLLVASGLADKLSTSRDAAARDRSWLDDYYEKQLRPLACDNYQPRYADISELPATHRTFRLRFWSWKSNLCKPFQKK